VTTTRVAWRRSDEIEADEFCTLSVRGGGLSLVGTILAADRAATKGREFYDDAYYAAFLKGSRVVLEHRLSEAASAAACVIVAAWTEAGQPKMPAKVAPTPARIRR
jgi:hypothetical protein